MTMLVVLVNKVVEGIPARDVEEAIKTLFDWKEEAGVMVIPIDQKIPKAKLKTEIVAEGKPRKNYKNRGYDAHALAVDVELIMQFLRENGRMRSEHISKATQLKGAYLRRLLGKLEEEGTLVRNGERRGTTYQIASLVKVGQLKNPKAILQRPEEIAAMQP